MCFYFLIFYEYAHCIIIFKLFSEYLLEVFFTYLFLIGFLLFASLCLVHHFSHIFRVFVFVLFFIFILVFFSLHIFILRLDLFFWLPIFIVRFFFLWFFILPPNLLESRISVFLIVWIGVEISLPLVESL